MKHKLLLFVIFFPLLSLNLSAQKSPFTFGVKAGMNLSSATINNREADAKLKPGYQVGVTVDFEVYKSLYLQSALSFTTKGSKIDDLLAGKLIGGSGKPNETHTYNQLYLQVPIHVAYKVNVGENNNIIFSFGPYFAYGIGGKSKRKLNDSAVFGDGSNQYKFDTFGDDEGEALKKFDVGLSFGVGTEFNKIVVGAGYELGLKNIAKYEHDKYKNYNIAVLVGYKF